MEGTCGCSTVADLLGAGGSNLQERQLCGQASECACLKWLAESARALRRPALPEAAATAAGTASIIIVSVAWASMQGDSCCCNYTEVAGRQPLAQHCSYAQAAQPTRPRNLPALNSLALPLKAGAAH